MTVAQLARELELTAATPLNDREITGAIASDLLSSVLANAAANYVWITIQTHRNVAMVASTQDLAAVIVCHGRQPEEELVRLARDEGIALLLADDGAYAVCGRLWERGVR